MGRMNTNAELIYFHRYERHKGFYKEREIDNALLSIRFADYVDIPDDEECPYYAINRIYSYIKDTIYRVYLCNCS